MIKVVSANCDNVFQQNKNIAFKGVILARVVQKNVASNGDVFYSTLMNKEGIDGIYKSLAYKVSHLKNMNIIKKLAAAINDFNIKNPVINSTIIGANSDCKRFLLTDTDADTVRKLGIKYYRNRNYHPDYFKNLVSKNIISDKNRRKFNKAGKELGIDLIVEDIKGKRKLVDIDIVTAEDLNKMKPALRKTVNSPSVEKSNYVQPIFDFFDEVKTPSKTHYDYE